MQDYITFEEYLVREPEAAYSNEYHDGKVFAMSDGTSKHTLQLGKSKINWEKSL